jgi:phosphoribosylformylglycinamidine synthase
LTRSLSDGKIKRKRVIQGGFSGMLRIYCLDQLRANERSALALGDVPVIDVNVVDCYYLDLSADLNSRERETLDWLIGGKKSEYPDEPYKLEVGPRLSFAPAWSTTATEICRRCGIDKVRRLDKSRIYVFRTKEDLEKARSVLVDRMTQAVYDAPLVKFETGERPDGVSIVPVLMHGIEAIKEAAVELGLAMDEDDIRHCAYIFTEVLKRNPTDVELFQIGQANSEHCRHHFFRANLIIDGVPKSKSLMDLIREPYLRNPANSVIAFHDDSSAIEGARALLLIAEDPSRPSALRGVAWRVLYTMTAETHNFPTGVAPFPGAATGTGGRIRDNESVGRGGRTSASLVGYATGDWRIPGSLLPWEKKPVVRAYGLKSPLEIMLGAMAGAWSYGNSFGEPVIGGWTRTMDITAGDTRYSYLRPILYSAGMGFMREENTGKEPAREGMLVVQLGGPAYPIGVGGGAASSRIGSSDTESFDFDAVQRGDPAMGIAVGRVIDACIALGEANPIRSAHDLGAGGDANALPEIVDPAGARIDLRQIPNGDESMSILKLWGNEAQERIAVLVWPKDLESLQRMSEREGAPIAVVGEVTGDGQLEVYDLDTDTVPVNLPLKDVLGEVPKKTIELEKLPRDLQPLDFPKELTVTEALDRVLRLPAVASKWQIILGVDRCVTGLIVQQQCVGPDQVPVSDYSIIADGYYSATGRVQSIGEKPMIGLVSAGAQGRMTVAEAITNMMGAATESIGHIRASVNVMAAAKQPGEGAWMYEAYESLSETMISLGVAADGGKDSLSMAVATSEGLVKGARQIVLAAYAPMTDIKTHATPDLKQSGNSIILVDLSQGLARLGGSALGQVYNQLGDEAPDLESPEMLAKTFEVVQELVRGEAIKSIHDRSDGGLITTVLEMAFAGAKGVEFDLEDSHEPLAAAFSEELGVVIETDMAEVVTNRLAEAGISHRVIGKVGSDDGEVLVRHRGKTVVRAGVLELRSKWEETGRALDEHQTDAGLVRDEETSRKVRHRAEWKIGFEPKPTESRHLIRANKPRIAVLREVGTNGDRELAASFEAAGFEAWDVMTSDLFNNRVRLDQFRGLAMAGGFSFGDVLGAGVGWGGEILFNKQVSAQLTEFIARPDTFSFGVCNGAQLALKLGLVGPKSKDEQSKFVLGTNDSERFECRFVTVEIEQSRSIMLRGMEGTRMGIWVAHGEGKYSAPDKALREAEAEQLIPIRYVDPQGESTADYPWNPNGSISGIAALCSPDGRHLAMMPHPERLAHGLWQWPYLPPKFGRLEASPWLRMFQNAYAWTMSSQETKSYSKL